jgi:hypothetical protein
MKCQFYDIFQKEFGDLDYSIKERVWLKIKQMPIIGKVGIFLLNTMRGEKKLKSSEIQKIKKIDKNVYERRKVLNLQKGEIVKVRSSEEISNTLDEKNKYERCEFMESMWQYCGKEYKVFKRVEKILDPWTDKLRKCKNLVILEGLICHGDPTHATECDRTCLYYWNEAWLERV